MLEWIDVFTVIAAGVILRFGIPVLLTGGIVWLLRRLDQKWQSEAQQTLQTQVKAGMIEHPRCWEVRNCPPEMRAQCAAFLDRSQPCWQVMRTTTGALPEKCFDCQVFRGAPALELHRAH